MHAGDEYGHTRNGNNNWYGHDTKMTHFDWDTSQDQKDFFEYYSALIKFRRKCPLLGRDEFLKPGDITWHEDNWSNPSSKFLAFTLHGKCGSFPALVVGPWVPSLILSYVMKAFNQEAMRCKMKAYGISLTQTLVVRHQGIFCLCSTNLAAVHVVLVCHVTCRSTDGH